ncbi:butyrophilin subfamily 1 member A1-like isoform X2 [Stegastes partitus]|uniref:Butyrophilin subfamily 1 member A1-like isoform X2 n=1 Tax=Stegastes partitus TaxID=144197 RepID=A0A9Y4U3H5_9TELE|nr:PREDICTED: butyrophilin subfamily 1 member A1-like isoform X2 [Stegastes partitus]
MRLQRCRSALSIVLLQHVIDCFFLLTSHRVSSSDVPLLIGPSQTVVAFVGDDVTLPCRLEPATDASAMRLEWARPDLSPGFVHVWADRREHVLDKQPSYRGRTSLLTDRLHLGDISLKLVNVTLSDEGPYRCLVPELGRKAFVKLAVCVVSTPVIRVMSRTSSSVVLQCESAGWYPEPELLWLDGEGKLLSAGPPETVRGPDDLYTVSSRVTVEKRHSNTFTCRVQQNNINQTREAHIRVAVLSRYVKGVLALGLLGVVLGLASTIHGCMREHVSRHKKIQSEHSNKEKMDV